MLQQQYCLLLGGRTANTTVVRYLMKNFIAMKHILLIFLLYSTQSCTLQKTSGKYGTLGYYKGSILLLNSDSTFSYSFRGHIFSDTAAGFFMVKGDTIKLNYTPNNFYLPFANSDDGIRIEGQLTSSRASIHRPKVLIVKGRRMYSLNVTTKKLIKSDKGGKSVYQYFTKF